MKWVNRPHLAYCYKYARRQMVACGFYDIPARYVFMIAAVASEQSDDRIFCEHLVDCGLRMNGIEPPIKRGAR